MTAQLVAAREDLEPGEAMRLELDAADGSLVEVALARAEDGTYYALADVCSHGQVSLSEGEVEGDTLECWLHGSTFDMKTGRPLSLPATRPVPAYPVSYDGDNVFVDVDAPLTVTADQN
ncbi:non-heme iron oxygenase ferredoxin subunit [Ruania alba]|uniref:3-phenylpropionate/trans-cinnamate dioxygenase ferredoxin subunit n=1 Tax=Ruania alba TaxID=648782 RepID=A0A1H5EIY4_9MICO|nr:non-heme iron oxygenase ferredoxin subunit [Ruania alba]SED90990.1 3-phenylpropionate/trans-cinnamate dioxygenase ferredoxin subunit [Ruania alba]